MSLQKERLRNMKTKVDPIKLTMDMVAIPSYSYMDNQEEAISQYILDFFLEHGLQHTGRKSYRAATIPSPFGKVRNGKPRHPCCSPATWIRCRLMILRGPSSRGKMRSMCTAEAPWT